MSTVKKWAADSITDSQAFMHQLQADDGGYTKLAALLKEHAGINMVLNDKNLTLMASRLASILKARAFNGYKKYYEYLASGAPGAMNEFICALTTNTTQFFREPVHFEVLKRKLVEIIEYKKKRHTHEIRIWCSAASTGQEVYTMMMVIQDQIKNLGKWNICFLATDIDHDVLERAASGIYQATEMNGIPEQYRSQFFNRLQDGSYQFKSEFREGIRFAQFNLLTEKYPFQYPFDVIFCRNVLIYFDRPTAEGVIERLARALRPGGFLFLGHSETGMMKSKILKNFSSAAYQRTEG